LPQKFQLTLWEAGKNSDPNWGKGPGSVPFQPLAEFRLPWGCDPGWGICFVTSIDRNGPCSPTQGEPRTPVPCLEWSLLSHPTLADPPSSHVISCIWNRLSEI
jgi:hypothetical protein